MKIELAHDFIAKKIYEEASIEDKSRAKATKLLKERYQHYLTAPNLLLTKSDLFYIEPYLNRMDLDHGELAYVKKSKEVIKKDKFNARLKDILIAASVCAIIFSTWGFWEHQRYTNTSEELATAQDSIDILVRNMKAYPLAGDEISKENNKEADGGVFSPSSLRQGEGLTQTFSTIKISGTVKNEQGEFLGETLISVHGAEVFSKADGSFELFLMLSSKDLNKNFQLKASKPNYFSSNQPIDTDKSMLFFNVVLRRD